MEGKRFFCLFLVFHSASERGRKELGTVGLLLSKGEGGGNSEKCGVWKLYPPPPQKNVIYENSTSPLAIAIFKMHPPPLAPPQPLLHQVSSSILGHWFHKLT